MGELQQAGTERSEGSSERCDSALQAAQGAVGQAGLGAAWGAAGGAKSSAKHTSPCCAPRRAAPWGSAASQQGDGCRAQHLR